MPSPCCKSVVKKKQGESEMKRDATAPSSKGQLCAEAVAEVDAEGVRADGLLAKRCLAGEVAAWEELYAQCHEPLLVSIRIMLGSQSSDANLVDEIAARVWYALVADDGALLARYKTNRGARLITFMRLRANSEIVRYIRSEVRHRKRELAALRQKPRHQGHDGEQPVNVLAEFFGTLTAREQVFCSKHLLGESSDLLGPTYSESNIWQLSHRIRRKLLRFLGQ
jgi:hypothetical protein